MIWDMHLKRWLAEFLDMIFGTPKAPLRFSRGR